MKVIESLRRHERGQEDITPHQKTRIIALVADLRRLCHVSDVASCDLSWGPLSVTTQRIADGIGPSRWDVRVYIRPDGRQSRMLLTGIAGPWWEMLELVLRRDESRMGQARFWHALAEACVLMEAAEACRDALSSLKACA